MSSRNLLAKVTQRQWALVAGLFVVVAALAALVVLGEGGSDDSAGEPGATAGTGMAGEPVEQFMHVHGLQIPSWSPDDVYLSTHHGLMLVDDSGDWHYAADDLHDFMGFAVNPQEPDMLYTSGHPAVQSGLQNPLGFMVSQDGGHSWEVRSLHGEVDFHALAVHPADGDVIYGWDATGGRLLASNDGGATWDQHTSPDAQGALALAVHPTDPSTILAATLTGVSRSTDGGDSWDNLADESAATAVAYDPSTPGRIVAYVTGPDGGLVESLDAGASWQPLGLQLGLDLETGENVVTHIAVNPDDPDIIYVGSLHQDLYRTVDGGASWEQLAADGVPQAASQ